MTALAGTVTAVLALAPAGASADRAVNPTSLTFGSQQVGTTSAAQSTTLTVSCSTFVVGLCVGPDLFLPTVAKTGDFAQTNNCPFVMVGGAAPQSCTINATFTPTAAGTRTGTITTGVGGPTVALTGTGVAPVTAPTGGAKGAVKKCKKKGKKKTAAAAKKKKCKKKKRGK
jgi:hypothetical protein